MLVSGRRTCRASALSRSVGQSRIFRQTLERSRFPGRLRGVLATLQIPRSIDDQALAAQAASGSRAAFEALVQRYGARVLSVLERRLGDHDRAHDLCQEVWIRVHRAFGRDEAAATKGSFRSWLFAIALNLARDEGRSRRRFRKHFEEQEPVEEAAEDRRADRIDQRDAIDAVLRGIDEPYRTAVVLVDVEGLSYEEAATSAGCALGTMKSRVARGRAAFRDGYEQITEARRETAS